MSNEALVIIDWQNDYFPGGLHTLVDAEPAARNAAALIAAFRKSGLPIAHVRHEFHEADAPFFRPGSEGAQIHALVTPQDGEKKILKHYPNAFRETDLKQWLDAQGITKLTIAGAMSHICIDGSVRAAVDYGFDVTLVHDAVATRDLTFNGVTTPAAQVHAAYMAALDFAYAKTTTTQAWLTARAQ